jgi:prevent-host-death family protein
MATEVGIRELKANLSAFVDRIEHGEVVTITRHGKPVARIVPPGISEGLAQLIADGTVRWSGRKIENLPKRIKLKGEGPLASDYAKDMSR